MTSSTRINTADSKQTSNRRDLTNFSIEAIIGSSSSTHTYDDSANRHHCGTGSGPMIKMKFTHSSVRVDDDKEIIDVKKNNNNQPQEQSARKLRPKNFLCSSCKMAFSNNGQLKNHIRIHTGERPFKCHHPDCDKTFTRNEELTRHKLIHSGFRPHACTTCGKRFGRKDHLKKHVRTHELKRNKHLKKRISFIPMINEDTIDNESKLVGLAKRRIEPPIPFEQPHILSTNVPTILPAASMMIDMAPFTSSSSHATIKTANQLGAPDAMFKRACFDPQQRLATNQHIDTSNVMAQQSTGTNIIQHFANEYWSSWYNLLSFCQPRQYNPRSSYLPAQHHLNNSTQH